MVGKKILVLRKQNLLSQEELASKLSISRQAISKWELGESMPDTMSIIHLSELFGVSTDYFLNDNYECDCEVLNTVIIRKDDSSIKSDKENSNKKLSKMCLNKNDSRRHVMWIGILVIIVLLTITIALLAHPNYIELYSSDNISNLSLVSNLLRDEGIKIRVEGRTNPTILVPANKLDEARNVLLSQDLVPINSSDNYD